MSENEVKTAVSAFQAARVGHDKQRKKEAALSLARTAAEYLSAGDKTPGDRKKLLQGLAMMVSGEGGKQRCQAKN